MKKQIKIPKSHRYCMLCKKNRKFVYNRMVGHSECIYCSSRMARKVKEKALKK